MCIWGIDFYINIRNQPVAPRVCIPEKDNPMWLQPVKSRAIAKWGYDGFRHLLFVVFKPGSVYVYYDVPARDFEEALSAESKGTWFNQTFKSKFYKFDELYRPPGLRPLHVARRAAKAPQPVLFHGVSKFYGPWFENWQH
jgi:hypothetical protein